MVSGRLNIQIFSLAPFAALGFLLSPSELLQAVCNVCQKLPHTGKSLPTLTSLPLLWPQIPSLYTVVCQQLIAK